MAAVNDLSEDMRKEIDNIYQAIAELSVRLLQKSQERKSDSRQTATNDIAENNATRGGVTM